MGMGFAPTWLRQVSPLLHKTTLTTGDVKGNPHIHTQWNRKTCVVDMRNGHQAEGSRCLYSSHVVEGFANGNAIRVYINL